MQRWFGAKIVVAVVVAGALFFSEYLTSPVSRGIAAAAGGALILFIDPILDHISDFRSSKQRLGAISKWAKYTADYMQFYAGMRVDTDALIKSLDSSAVEPSPEKIAHMIFYELLPLSSPEQRDAVYLPYLCSLIDQEPDELRRSTLKERLSQVISRYDFAVMDANAQMLMRCYANHHHRRPFNAPGTYDYRQVFDVFSLRYTTATHIAVKLYLEKEQSEEFRRTLSTLIARGRLDMKLLDKQLGARIEQEIRTAAGRSKAYLLLSNKWHEIEAVKARLDALPGIVIGRKFPHLLPDAVTYLHMRIIYPPKIYRSPDTFITDEILPLIPKDQLREGFISIIPIEGTEIYSYPPNVDAISNEKIRESYRSVSSIKTGIAYNFADIFLDKMHGEVKIHDLLSIMPFNIFVPDLGDRGREFIIDNYDDLKKKWNIKTLSDWADVSATDLKNELIRLDIAHGGNRVYVDPSWERHAQTIVLQAKKHRDAMSA